MLYQLHEAEHLHRAADTIASGDIIGFFFNGGYALLGDADQLSAADRIFELKRRPRSRGLSLLTDPEHWSEFVDLEAVALQRFPIDRAVTLFGLLHALGVRYPADPERAPAHLVQDGTILNVWTEYRPLRRLLEVCRTRGVRGLQGASANLSGDRTYTTAPQMVEVFGRRLPVVFEQEEVPEARRQSTSLLDLTGEQPTLFREGNTSTDEVGAAVAKAGLGDLALSPELVRLS